MPKWNLSTQGNLVAIQMLKQKLINLLEKLAVNVPVIDYPTNLSL